MTPNDVQAQAGANIKLICTDVDGTLLNSKQHLTDGVVQAIQEAFHLGVPVRPPPLAPSVYFTIIRATMDEGARRTI